MMACCSVLVRAGHVLLLLLLLGAIRYIRTCLQQYNKITASSLSLALMRYFALRVLGEGMRVKVM